MAFDHTCPDGREALILPAEKELCSIMREARYVLSLLLVQWQSFVEHRLLAGRNHRQHVATLSHNVRLLVCAEFGHRQDGTEIKSRIYLLFGQIAGLDAPEAKDHPKELFGHLDHRILHFAAAFSCREEWFENHLK